MLRRSPISRRETRKVAACGACSRTSGRQFSASWTLRSAHIASGNRCKHIRRWALVPLRLNPRLQQLEELLHCHLGLAKNAPQNTPRQVKAVMPWNRHPEMRSLGVAKLRVASSLMVDDESRLQESAKDSPRAENRKVRRHLRRQRNAYFVLVSKPFVGDRLARLSQAFQVTPNGIPGHRPGFAQGSPVGHQPRQQGNSYLVPRLRLQISATRGSPPSYLAARQGASHQLPHREVHNSESEVSRLQFFLALSVYACLGHFVSSLTPGLVGVKAHKTSARIKRQLRPVNRRQLGEFCGLETS